MFIDDDVDLDVELVAGVVGLQALDSLDGFGKAHGHVEQDVALVSRGTGAGEIANMLCRGATPVDDDVGGEQDAAECVEPPDLGKVADEGEEDGKGVKDDVGHGVLGEGLDGRVADEAAPEPAEALDGDGAGHDGDGGDSELDDGVVGAGEAGDAFYADLEERGHHDDGEDEHANGLQTSAANGVGVTVLPGDHPASEPDNGGGEEVERCVDQTSEDGEGRGHNGDDDLQKQEDSVGAEVKVEGPFDNRALGVLVPIGHPVAQFGIGHEGCIFISLGKLVEVFRRAFDLAAQRFAGCVRGTVA